MKAMIKTTMVMVALCLVASPAMANVDFSYGGRDYTSPAQVVLSWNGVWHGGHFDVSTVPATGTLPTATPFPTFCVESQIYFSPGTAYYATIDNWAARGFEVPDTTSINPLTNKAAWIYQQYLDGQLSTYSDQTVSEAIWQEMGQSGGQVNAVTALADLANPGSIGNVRVLNLWTLGLDSNDKVTSVIDVQSHLIAVPVPAAAGLVAVGLGLIGWFRRRIA